MGKLMLWILCYFWEFFSYVGYVYWCGDQIVYCFGCNCLGMLWISLKLSRVVCWVWVMVEWYNVWDVRCSFDLWEMMSGGCEVFVVKGEV